jgi:hypothetical protein
MWIKQVGCGACVMATGAFMLWAEAHPIQTNGSASETTVSVVVRVAYVQHVTR